MKKIIITIALASFALASQAQLFVGGSIGFETESGKRTFNGVSTDMPSCYLFEFSPKIGYFISDKFAVGLQPELLIGAVKSISNNVESKHSITSWHLDAFARYEMLSIDKLAFIMKGTIGFGGYGCKRSNGGTITKGNPGSWFGINVVPILSYRFTNKFSLEAEFNFLNLGFNRTTNKQADNSSNKTTFNNFVFGVNSANYFIEDLIEDHVFATADPIIKIGIVYKF
jgi:outer membrane protein